MQTGHGPHWRTLLSVALVVGSGHQAPGQQAEAWATLRGHAGGVLSLAFAPNGRVLASASRDGTVRLWEVLAAKRRATLSGHRGGVYEVAFAPDGKLLASGGDDGAVRFWDAAGQVCGSLKAQDGGVQCLAFTPDSTTLAVGGGSKDPSKAHLRLWDVRRGKERLVFRGHDGIVTAIAFSADGRMLAGGDWGGGVTLWETASGKVRASLKGHRGFVSGVAFVPGGDLLASSGLDGTVRLWDVRAGKQRAVLEGHGYATCVAPVGSGRVLASAGDDRSVRLWDTVTGEQLLLLELDDPVWSVAFHPDGKLLAAGDKEGMVHLWSVTGLPGPRAKKQEPGCRPGTGGRPGCPRFHATAARFRLLPSPSSATLIPSGRESSQLVRCTRAALRRPGVRLLTPSGGALFPARCPVPGIPGEFRTGTIARTAVSEFTWNSRNRLAREPSPSPVLR